MVSQNKGEEMETIETTVGDLICAITDAALEDSIEENELNRLTHQILIDLLSRYRTNPVRH